MYTFNMARSQAQNASTALQSKINVGLFLFEGVPPTKFSDIPFDTSDPSACWENACGLMFFDAVEKVGLGEGYLDMNPADHGNFMKSSYLETDGTTGDPQHYRLIPEKFRVLSFEPGGAGDGYSYEHVNNIKKTCSALKMHSKDKVLAFYPTGLHFGRNAYEFEYEDVTQVDGWYYKRYGLNYDKSMDIEYWDEALDAGAGGWVLIDNFSGEATAGYQRLPAEGYKFPFTTPVSAKKFRIIDVEDSAHFLLSSMGFYSNVQPPNFVNTFTPTWGITLTGHYVKMVTPYADIFTEGVPQYLLQIGGPLDNKEVTLSEVDGINSMSSPSIVEGRIQFGELL